MKLSMDRLPEQILRPFAMKFLTTALGPSPDLFRHGAILVNAEGRRFAEETQKPALKVPHQPDRLAYIVMDADIAARFEAWPYFISTAPGIAYAYLADYRRNRPDIYKVGSTPQELAKAMGIDPWLSGGTAAIQRRRPLGAPWRLPGSLIWTLRGSRPGPQLCRLHRRWPAGNVRP
jgi:fumarate reductase flavoprotein subunit